LTGESDIGADHFSAARDQGGDEGLLGTAAFPGALLVLGVDGLGIRYLGELRTAVGDDEDGYITDGASDRADFRGEKFNTRLADIFLPGQEQGGAAGDLHGVLGIPRLHWELSGIRLLIVSPDSKRVAGAHLASESGEDHVEQRVAIRFREAAHRRRSFHDEQEPAGVRRARRLARAGFPGSGSARAVAPAAKKKEGEDEFQEAPATFWNASGVRCSSDIFFEKLHIP